jgi:ethanolamine permease
VKTILPFLRNLSISVGMAMASSCFAMIACMAGDAGWWLLPALTLSLLVALGIAHSVARLAKRFPSAPGVRTYLKAAFGNRVSLFFVSLYLLMIALVAGVESNLYASIVHQVVPAVEARWVLLALFAGVFAINVRGYEVSRNLQLVLVALLLGGVLALSWYAIVSAPSSMPPTASAGHWAALPTTTVTAFFLFVGFEWVTSAQPGSRQAAAQLPRVLVSAVLLLGSVYLCFSAAALLRLGPVALSTTRTPQMLLAVLVWGEPGRWIMLVVNTAAVLMAFNAGVIGACRLVYSLAREGCLPRLLSTTADSGVPLHALGVTVAVSLACSLVARAAGATALLASAAAVIVCLCYAGLLSASLALARKQAERGVRGSITEGAALLAMVVLLLAMLGDPGAWRQSLVAAAACTLSLLYATYAHARARASGTATARRHGLLSITKELP